jgi:hypothetical protein
MLCIIQGDKSMMNQKIDESKDKSTKRYGFSRRAENNIFIAESLTRKKKLLFNACLKFKKDHGFRFI